MSYETSDHFVGARGFFDDATPEAATSDVPPGWSRNPSARRRRQLFAAVATVGLLATCYLALYQLGVLPRVFEPLFGDGSRRALDTWVGRLLPGSEAAVASVSFFAQAVLALLGPDDRWRTRPGLAIALGVIAGPLALVGVALTIVQTAVFDAWCTLCLASAAIAAGLAGVALEEALAALQALRRRAEDRGPAFPAPAPLSEARP